MNNMNVTIRDMARDFNAKRMAERELLIARFVLEHPNCEAKDICLVEQFDKGKVTFSVRMLTEQDKRTRGDSLQ